MSRFFTFYCIFIFTFLGAQEKDSIRRIDGRIFFDQNGREELQVDGIFITNLQSNSYDISNGLGEFQLSAAVGDTLFFESYLFEPRRNIVSARVWQSRNLSAYLSEAIVNLDEVVINAWSPFLREQVNESEVSKSVNRLYANMGMAGIRDVEVKEYIDPLNVLDFIPTQINLGRISQAIAGDLRRKRNLYAFEQSEGILDAIKSYFGEDYFANEVKIPVSLSREFVLFCLETSNLKSMWEVQDYLSIQTLFEEKAKVYNKRLKEHWKLTNPNLIPTQSSPEASN